MRYIQKDVVRYCATLFGCFVGTPSLHAFENFFVLVPVLFKRKGNMYDCVGGPMNPQ